MNHENLITRIGRSLKYSRLAANLFVLGGLAVLSFGAYATDVYKWVDESGQTHFSNVVPDQYKNAATKVEAKQPPVAPAQRREAQNRAAQDKEKLKQADKNTQRGAQQIRSSASGRNGRSDTASKSEECDKLFSAYWKSQECFAPYRNANGGLHEEAFKKCTEVPDPTAQCGQRNIGETGR